MEVGTMEILNNTFLQFFSQLQDPRLNNANKKHLLIDIIAITVCAVICGYGTWEEISYYGEEKKSWLKKFLKLPNGIPSHDTFRRIFMILDPKEFNRCFLDWTASFRKSRQGEVIAVDGKTICGSGDPGLGKRAIHMVSAWATENGIVLGQEKVDEKSNEITAIPEVLKSINIKDCTVTIDAMGCQTEIASQIISQKGNYVLALKKNQQSFYERVEQAFGRGFEADFKGMDYDYWQTIDEKRGRHEERNYFTIKNIEFLNRSKEWEGLSSIGLAESIVNRNGSVSIEKRYYISSLSGNAREFGEAVRKHWQIENNLHWVLDVQFGDDDDVKRSKNSAANFSMAKRIALNLLKSNSDPGKLKKKRMKAVMNNQFLEKLLLGG